MVPSLVLTCCCSTLRSHSVILHGAIATRDAYAHELLPAAHLFPLQVSAVAASSLGKDGFGKGVDISPDLQVRRVSSRAL